MCRFYLKIIKVLLVPFLICLPVAQSTANISGLFTLIDIDQCEYSKVNNTSENITAHIAPSCYGKTSDSYVPKSGNYSVRTKVYVDNSLCTSMDTYSSYIDETKTITEQNIMMNNTGGTYECYRWYPGTTLSQCMVLIDDAGHEYRLSRIDCADGGVPPLPPTPPVPDTSCTINNGNTLTVELETVERANLTTVPGAGSGIKQVSVPITCIGGVDVPVKMQFSYTPISVSGTQIVKSSSAGLGVAIIYNDKALATTDVTPATFNTGSSVLNLGFQAIRDPAVPVADVPTGAFNASASLIMTQQ